MRLLGLLLLLLLPVAGARGQGGDSLVIVGATSYPAEQLRGKLATTTNPDSAATELRQFYFQEGFLDADVRREGTTLVVQEGEAYRFGMVTELAFPDSLGRALAAIPPLDSLVLRGQRYRSVLLEEFLRGRLAEFAEQGYPLAVAELHPTVQSGTATINLQLQVRTGDQVRISKIDVVGCSADAAALVRAAARVQPDQPFTPAAAQSVRERLTRLRLFSEVAEPQLFRYDSGYGSSSGAGNRYGLLVRVAPGNANSFDGIIGYQPGSAPGESGAFTGYLSVTLRDLFGAGRRLTARAQFPGKGAQELAVGYSELYIFRLPLNFQFEYRQTQEAATASLTSYVQRFFTADLSYEFADAWRFRVGGDYEATIPTPDSTGDCFRQLLNSTLLGSTVGIEFDNRSNPYSPRSGVRYSSSYQFAGRSIASSLACADSTLGTDAARQKIEIDLEAYWPITRTIVAAAGLHGGQVTGGMVDESDLYFMGGQSTVRGYYERQFRAAQRAWGGVELRLLLSELSYVGAFVDGGWYQRPATRTGGVAASDWLAGYGVAGQIETPLGLARIGFALSRDDTPETGKVFVGLVNQF
ncbi:MAG: hypothetical protein DYG96_00030 [Chlorobi bacterium CHB2]|nr:hypothetical protein [Chlorobi bacterium CHB2]